MLYANSDTDAFSLKAPETGGVKEELKFPDEQAFALLFATAGNMDSGLPDQQSGPVGEAVVTASTLSRRPRVGRAG